MACSVGLPRWGEKCKLIHITVSFYRLTGFFVGCFSSLAFPLFIFLINLSSGYCAIVKVQFGGRKDSAGTSWTKIIFLFVSDDM